MITLMGWKFSWSALSDLMDHSLDDEEQAAICATLEATPGVRSAHDLRTRRMGDLAMVGLHILVDSRISVSEGHYIAANARQRVLDAHRVLDVMVHIDPEDDSGHSRQMLALPHRAQVEDTGRGAGRTRARPHQPGLHYLNGVLELDAVLDPQTCRRRRRARTDQPATACPGWPGGRAQSGAHSPHTGSQPQQAIA